MTYIITRGGRGALWQPHSLGSKYTVIFISEKKINNGTGSRYPELEFELELYPSPAEEHEKHGRPGLIHHVSDVRWTR